MKKLILILLFIFGLFIYGCGEECEKCEQCPSTDGLIKEEDCPKKDDCTGLINPEDCPSTDGLIKEEDCPKKDDCTGLISPEDCPSTDGLIKEEDCPAHEEKSEFVYLLGENGLTVKGINKLASEEIIIPDEDYYEGSETAYLNL